MTNNNDNIIQPFLRWPGGKRWLAKRINKLIDIKNHLRYVEPFVGGGSIYFRLLPNNAIISDINKELIITYKAIKNNPIKVLNILRKMPTGKEEYYEIRDKTYSGKIETAARFLYLNRLAFGGMYRVNKKGKFNVPYGGDRRVSILWENNLIVNASKALKNTKIYCNDFSNILKNCQKGDLVYCDPAYTVTHNNNGFLRYNENIFSWNDQKRLANTCFEAAQKGAQIIVSNAGNESILKLYRPITPIAVQRYSGVSCQTKGRGSVKEYIFVINKKTIHKKVISDR